MVAPLTLRLIFSVLATCVLTGSACAAHSNTAKRQVVTADTLEWKPGVEDLQYSPDKTFIAVEFNNKISVWSRADRTRVQQLGEGLSPRWSRNGDRLAFYSSRNGALQLWLWQRDTGALSQLTDLHGGIDNDPSLRFGGWVQSALSYSWAPDGSTIVLPIRRSAFARFVNPMSPRVFHGTEDVSPLAGVFTHPGLADGITEVGDGRSFKLRHRRLGETLSYQLAVVDTRTREITEVRADGYVLYNPVWLPDGHQILAGRIPVEPEQDSFTYLYVTDAVRNSEIATLETVSGKWKTLVSGQGVRSNFKLSPDGRRLAFFVGDIRRAVNVQVKILRLDDASQVTVKELIGQPLWDFGWASDDCLLVQTFSTILRYFTHDDHIEKVLSGIDSLAPAANVSGRIQWAENSLLLETEPNKSNRKVIIDFDRDRLPLQLGTVRELNRAGFSGDCFV